MTWLNNFPWRVQVKNAFGSGSGMGASGGSGFGMYGSGAGRGDDNLRNMNTWMPTSMWYPCLIMLVTSVISWSHLDTAGHTWSAHEERSGTTKSEPRTIDRRTPTPTLDVRELYSYIYFVPYLSSILTLNPFIREIENTLIGPIWSGWDWPTDRQNTACL